MKNEKSTSKAMFALQFVVYKCGPLSGSHDNALYLWMNALVR